METVRGEIDQSGQIARMTRIVLRPMASGLPVGMFGFGIGIVMITALDTHIIPLSMQLTVAIAALAFAAPLEAVAAVFGLLERDGGAAATMAIFSASWVVQGIMLLNAPADAPSAAVGVFIAMLTLYLAGLAAISLKGKPLLAGFLVLAALRMASYAAVQFGAPAWAQTMENVTGWGLCLASLYGAFAFLIEDAQQHEVLPVFRHGQARSALTGDLAGQLNHIEHEAGVRRQL